MVSGTTRRSCARARRSISISRLSFLRGQPLQGVLADGAELALVHVAQQPLFEVGVAEAAGVVVAQHALDLGGGQDLADDVEDGVVVQGVADLLQLLQQPLQDAAFDGVGRDEVEDQAVLASGRSGGCGPSAARGGSGSRGCRS